MVELRAGSGIALAEDTTAGTLTVSASGGGGGSGIGTIPTGLVADDNGTTGTDNHAALQAALDAMVAAATDTDGFVKGAGKLIIPRGKYYCSASLDVLANFIIEGEATMGHAPATQIRFADGVSGFRLHFYDTSGDDVAGASHSYGQYTTLRNLGIIGPLRNTESGITGGEAEQHAIHAMTTFVVEDCYLNGFRGDGLHCAATSGGGSGSEGNANISFVNRLRVTNLRNGVYIDGADSNAMTLIGVNGTYCRQHTVWDSSFLGNTHMGHHSSSAGMIPGVPPSIVTRGGNRYNVVQGQATGASTNAPPSATVTMTIASPAVVTWTAHGLPAGTAVAFSTTGALPTGLVANTLYYVLAPTTNTFNVAATAGGAAINTSGSQSGVHTASAAIDNTWWLWLNAGGVDLTANIPAWVSGTTYREGGCYRTDNPNATNLLIGLYAESGQGPLQAVAPTQVIGGLWGERYPVTTGNWFAGDRIIAPSPSGNTFGQTRIAGSSNSRTLAVNNSNPLSGGIYASVNFEVGLEADGVTQANLAAVTARSSSGTPSTAEGLIEFWTRTSGGTGGMTSRVQVDGPNSAFHPSVDNSWDSGLTGTRWKTVWGYTGDFTTQVKIATVKVLGARATGWTADTGTAKRTANASYAAGTTLTYSAAYVQAEQTAMATRMAAVEAALQNISQTQKGLKDDLIAHGLIGT